MIVRVGIFSCSLTGALTIQDARDAALFRVGEQVTINGETHFRVTHRDMSTGIATVAPAPHGVVHEALVESAWPLEVMRALYDHSAPLEERVGMAAIAAAERGMRIRTVASAMAPFEYMTRRLGAKIEFNELTDATWCTLMTAAGPVRVFTDGMLRGDAASLDANERQVLYTTERARQSVAQLQRRAELETEDAERLMTLIEATKAEIASRQ